MIVTGEEHANAYIATPSFARRIISTSCVVPSYRSLPLVGVEHANPSRARSSPFSPILRDKKKSSAGGENGIDEKDASSELIGITFLFISLCFDGGTGAYEDKLMSVHSVGPFGESSGRVYGTFPCSTCSRRALVLTLFILVSASRKK